MGEKKGAQNLRASVIENKELTVSELYSKLS